MEPSNRSSVAYSEPAGLPREERSPGWAKRVRSAIEGAQRRLLGLQREDGHWCAELEGDTILESEYIMTMHYLGRSGEVKVEKAAQHLRNRQLEDGGWPLYPEGPADVSASVKAYFVLKLLGDGPQAPHMERARRVILRLGGIEACNSFTKLYLSIFGQYEWMTAPAVPPEITLLPKWLPFNIYEISSWSRAIVVPLSIIWAARPQCGVPAHAVIDELRATGGPRRVEPAVGGEMGRAWARFFLYADRVFKLFERWNLTPLRRLALSRAERWILDRVAGSDGLAAIFPPIINTIIALDCLGYSQDHPVLRDQIRQLEKLEIEEEDTLRVQPCFSPVWDTSLSISALAESDLSPGDPDLVRSARWLLDKEVRRPGDWTIKNPGAPVGGWFFEYANQVYPDCDDTAEVLTALSKVQMPDEERERQEAVSRRGLEWLLSMQNRDGGWASFDRSCDKEYLTLVPFADHNAMIDPSTVDITGRVLETLSCFGHDRESAPVRRGVEFILANQEADGSWYGRWGCNYLYGTWLALWGLAAVGEDTTSDWGRRAANWIRSCQNSDGGWGELPASYDDPALKGRGPSSAAQTSWALMALFAAGDAAGDAVRRGVEYLLENQLEEGGWFDEAWTGTGFPRVFYLRYHYYALYFPLAALAHYARRLEGSVQPPAAGGSMSILRPRRPD